MPEHAVPLELIEAITSDLSSRMREAESVSPEHVNTALAMLRSLPHLEDEAELEISWYSQEDPPAAVNLQLNASILCLSVQDEDGSTDIYRCSAGSFPEIDNDDYKAWLRHFRCLDDAEITISVYLPASGSPPQATSPVATPECKLAELRHPNFYSSVTLEIRGDGTLRMLVYDTGAAPTAAFGGDFDRWVDVDASSKDALLLALLREKYRGDTDAVPHFRQFCERYQVPHRYEVY